MVVDRSAKTVALSVPKANFGTVGSGWVFTLALTGQDGFSGDQARGFAPTPQPFQFGVCAPGGASPICSVDPGSVPKVIDTIPPAGVAQSTELDPTLGPVVLRGVSVPPGVRQALGRRRAARAAASTR
jgi:glucoamylase